MTVIDAVLDDANVTCDVLRDNLVIDAENNRKQNNKWKGNQHQYKENWVISHKL